MGPGLLCSDLGGAGSRGSPSGGILKGLKSLIAARGLKHAIIIAILSIVGATSASAQATTRQREELSHLDSTRVISIATNDGSTFGGRVVAVHAESVEMQTSAGRVTVTFASMR